ncbi:unnamed protein product [Rhodiola kirilowii]
MGTEKKWMYTLFFAAFISVLLFLSTLLGSTASYLFTTRSYPSTIRVGPNYPPAFAYYITGGRGDRERILRLMMAVYHPRNRYLLHIDAEGSDDERMMLLAGAMAVPAVRVFGNVDVVGKADRVTYMGASNVAATLRAVAILLKVDSGWDWFIELNALDYPLISQDDLSHVFSSVNRDVNFIDHTSELGWKESQRVQPIVVDPAIYLARRSQIFQATQKRPTPDAFKFFTGSPWSVLSRSFLEYCVLGWDNLPRTLLMYFNNVMLSQEGYFHSVVCNAPEFKNTTINNNLRYTLWDNPPKMEPLYLSVTDFNQMTQSGAAFARQFQKDDPVLNMIDEKILNRDRYRVTPGAWCTGHKSWLSDPCSQWGDVNKLKPGLQAVKFDETITNLLDDLGSHANQCQ